MSNPEFRDPEFRDPKFHDPEFHDPEFHDPEFHDPGQQPYSGPPPTVPYPGAPFGVDPTGPAGHLSPPSTPYGYQSAPYGYQVPPYGYQPAPYGYQVSPYGYPGRGSRPGTLTASAVLGYITGGLLILAATFVFFGASVADDVESATDSTTSLDAEFIVAGIVNLLAAGLFIGGSVSMTSRSLTGRALYATAAGLTVVASLYWGIRFAARYDGLISLMIYALLFAALAIVGVSLAFTPTGSRWLAGR